MTYIKKLFNYNVQNKKILNYYEYDPYSEAKKPLYEDILTVDCF